MKLLEIGPWGVIVIILLALLILLAAVSIRIVPQANAYVVERFGAYHKTLGTGIHFIFPFVCRVSKRISLKEQVVDFDPQPVITKDNVTMQIDTVVFFEITDPKQFAYGGENTHKLTGLSIIRLYVSSYILAILMILAKTPAAVTPAPAP